MRQSKLFTKARKEAPADEAARNAQLLIRAGYIHKEMAGVYSYLPLGLRVLAAIERIIRGAMDAIGGQEMRMATLHPSEPWKKSGGWEAVDVLFKLQSRTEKEYALGQSEEEIATPIAAEYALSYRDLPLAIYQIGQKYRDELRAKSGIMRGREFGMKDMYSFHESQEDFERFYEVVKRAYLAVYEKLGLTAKVTEASGGAFSEKISYEFMVLTEAGEDDILYCEACTYCANVEVAKEREGDSCPKCSAGALKKARASEVGNVFDLGQKYPKAFGYTFKDKEGKPRYPIVGCYGFGTTRVMGVIAEKLADEKGLAWPESAAPFLVHLLCLTPGDEKVVAAADALYDDLRKAGVDVLYDDRDQRAGEKLAEADLIGIPARVVVSAKTLAAGKVESTYRRTGQSALVSREECIEFASGAQKAHRGPYG
ncbi:MAG TPA: aminoacyl--tRNA ligase-related protein [Candidatus Paceibacterota bacterium]|nr:aminoacyl--tRNA ligase-related protein [Candidatus Paceibacterota bacterium]